MSALEAVGLLDARRSVAATAALVRATGACAHAEGVLTARRAALEAAQARARERGEPAVTTSARALRERAAFEEAMRADADACAAAFLIACAERDAAVAELHGAQRHLAELEARHEVVQRRIDDAGAVTRRLAEARSDDGADR